jgi:hypothetical protein
MHDPPHVFLPYDRQTYIDGKSTLSFHLFFPSIVALFNRYFVMGAYEDESRQGTVYAAYIIPIPFITISTALRIYVKMEKGGFRHLTLDDYLIVFGMICALGVCGSGLAYGPPYGFGKHIDTLSAYDIKMFFKGDYIFSHFYNITLGAVKLSILAFYYRIFVIPMFQRVVLFSMTFVGLWMLTITVVLAMQCRPIEKFWDATVEGTCFNLVAFSYFTNISNLVTDLWIFFLPVPVIVRLNMTPRRKAGLCGVFLIGLATCGISAARLEYVVAQGSTDFTWDGVSLGAFSALEPMGAILCANLPIVYQLFKHHVSKWKSSISGLSKLSSKFSTNPSSASGNSRNLPTDKEKSGSWSELRNKSLISSPASPGRPESERSGTGDVYVTTTIEHGMDLEGGVEPKTWATIK